MAHKGELENPPREHVVAEVWCIIKDIGKIDTATMTVEIKVDLYASWYDNRLKGREYIEWDEVWHPTYALANATVDAVSDDIKCDKLVDDDLFMCWLSVVGPISNRMDLRAFPFDFDDIEVIMDASNVDNAPDISELDFRPVAHPELNPVADYVLTFSNMYDPVRDMLEFSVFELETQRSIFRVGQIKFPQINYRIKVMRKPKMALAKAILPLFLTGLISLPPLQMDITKGYTDRVNYCVTMFLATCAFVYVIEGDTPSTPYLKTLDKLMGVTIIVPLSLCLETMFVKWRSDVGAIDCVIDPTKTSALGSDIVENTCTDIDRAFGMFITLGFTVSFLLILGKALFDFYQVSAGLKFEKHELHSHAKVYDRR
jgi:hypothetical protein